MPGVQQSFYRFYDAGVLEWTVDVHVQDSLLITALTGPFHAGSDRFDSFKGISGNLIVPRLTYRRVCCMLVL